MSALLNTLLHVLHHCKARLDISQLQKVLSLQVRPLNI